MSFKAVRISQENHGAGTSGIGNSMCQGADGFQNLETIFTLELFKSTLTHFSDSESQWQQKKNKSRLCNYLMFIEHYRTHH